jgi:hypothetical protein
VQAVPVQACVEELGQFCAPQADDPIASAATADPAEHELRELLCQKSLEFVRPPVDEFQA